MPRSKGSDNSQHGKASIGKTGKSPNARRSSKFARRITRAGGPEAKVTKDKPTISGKQTRRIPRDTPRVTGAQKRKARKGTGRYTAR